MLKQAIKEKIVNDHFKLRHYSDTTMEITDISRSVSEDVSKLQELDAQKNQTLSEIQQLSKLSTENKRLGKEAFKESVADTINLLTWTLLITGGAASLQSATGGKPFGSKKFR